jgi:hypothetical protein
MQIVTLQFRDISTLWSFAKTLKGAEFKVDTKKKQICCCYDEKLITEALVFFNAKMISDTAKK